MKAHSNRLFCVFLRAPKIPFNIRIYIRTTSINAYIDKHILWMRFGSIESIKLTSLIFRRTRKNTQINEKKKHLFNLISFELSVVWWWETPLWLLKFSTNFTQYFLHAFYFDWCANICSLIQRIWFTKKNLKFKITNHGLAFTKWSKHLF